MALYMLLVIISSLGLGTTLVFMSSHWLLAWIGLEVNTLAILPLMAHHHHPRASEAATKYFLIQSCGAGMLLFATALNALLENQWEITQINNYIATSLVIVALALKLGLAPFHYWLPEVMQGLDLTTGLILSTWQKLAPFALLLQISYTIHPHLLTTLGITSAMMASWAGLNQTQMRKILAYSSIANLGWTFIIVYYAPNLAILGLGIYIILTTAAFMSIMESSSTKISVFSLSWSKNPIIMVMMISILLSLAGLPPLTGFLSKLFILEEMSKQEMALPAALMLLSALISLYFYVRLCYFSIITLFPSTTKLKTSWRRKNKHMIMLPAIVTAATILLPLSPLIMAFTHFCIP